jgi:hypothetical protein
VPPDRVDLTEKSWSAVSKRAPAVRRRGTTAVPTSGVGGPDDPEETEMRYMVIVKANEDSEKGVMPTTEQLAEMGKFNEELVKAGVMLDGDGLAPSSQGARIRYDENGSTTVTDGPFAETKELIAGYWVLQVSSREEVVEWMRKAPFRNAEIEIRRFHEAEDFGEAFTPELREQEERLRAESAAHRGA